jgi:hypothetical protein
MPFDEEKIDFVGWEPSPVDMRRVTPIGGSEVEFANQSLVRWRRLPSGRYVFVRAHFSRVILDMRPSAP